MMHARARTKATAKLQFFFDIHNTHMLKKCEVRLNRKKKHF